MPYRRLALVIGLLFLPTTYCLTAQTIRQEENRPLLPPNLVMAGDPLGTGNILVGFGIASLPSIPFSATIEAENQIVDGKGNNTVRRFTKIARDAKGRTRIEIDLNAVGVPSDPKLVTVHIYDPVTKADLTIFPWHQSALRYEDKPQLGRRPGAIALEPDHLGLGKQSPSQIDTQREDLDVEVMEGMQLRHGRETTSYPAGFAGNKSAHTVVTDYWYSQELQSFVLVKQLGPFNGSQTLTLHNIRRENPNPSLFKIPKDYKVQ